MEKLDIRRLDVGTVLDRPLFHSSGETLAERGRAITADLVQLLHDNGIDEVLRPEAGEDPGQFVRQAKNRVLPVDHLTVGQRMSQPVFDSHDALLLDAGSVVTASMSASMKRRGVYEVFVRKTTQELGLDQVQAFRRAMRNKHARRPEPVPADLGDTPRVAAADCTPEKVDRMIEALDDLSVHRTGRPLQEDMSRPAPLAARSEESKAGFQSLYEEALGKTAVIFRALESGRELDEQQVGALAAGVVGGLVADRDLALNLPNMRTAHDYLLGHSLGVTVLSASVAASMGYNREQVLGMAFAAYLHDIGMLKVPPEIVGRAGKLTPAELVQVRHHPVHSLDILQRLVGRRSGIPAFVPIVAYQTHECEDGSGYPKGRKACIIHDFARILSVCDAYEAMTSRRAWREPLLPYHAMEQVISSASRGIRSREVVRALLRYISLFPIGSWVELSDGAVARVVAASESDFSRPAVSVIFRGGRRTETPERLDLAADGAPTVVRPIPAPEGVEGLMEGF